MFSEKQCYAYLKMQAVTKAARNLFVYQQDVRAFCASANIYHQITVNKVAGALGAEVEGIELHKPLTANLKADLKKALNDHSVLVFRNQSLEPQSHMVLAEVFGKIEAHPIVKGLPDYPNVLQIVKEPGAPTRFGEVWHSDNSYLERPTSISILRSLEVPPYGNDTLLTSTYASYDTLSEGMKATLLKLKAVHSAKRAFSVEGHRKENFDEKEGKMAYMVNDILTQETLHPVVCTHPDTGRPALYINSMFTLRFDGWTEEESKPLLDFLFHHIARPEYSCRIVWAPGTVLMWDNQCTQHIALGDNWEHRRIMQRVTVQGPRPSQ